MPDFTKDLNRGQIKEKQFCRFLSDKVSSNFYCVDKLENKSKTTNVILEKNKIAQIDLVYINGENWHPIEVKYDSPEMLTPNCFCEFQDVSDDGIMKSSGTTRMIKNHIYWLAIIRDRIKFNKGMRIFCLSPFKLRDLIDENKFRIKTVRNRSWTTYGYLIPDEQLKEICFRVFELTNQEIEKYFT